MEGYAAAFGVDRRGGDGCGFRGRLGARRAGGDARQLYRVLIECVRDSGTARHVFRAGERVAEVAVSRGWACGSADICGCEDGFAGTNADPDRDFPGDYSGDHGSGGGSIAATSEGGALEGTGRTATKFSTSG